MTASRRPHPVRRQLRAVEHQDEAAAARLIAIRDERRELFEWAYRRKIEAEWACYDVEHDAANAKDLLELIDRAERRMAG